MFLTPQNLEINFSMKKVELIHQSIKVLNAFDISSFFNTSIFTKAASWNSNWLVRQLGMASLYKCDTSVEMDLYNSKPSTAHPIDTTLAPVSPETNRPIKSKKCSTDECKTSKRESRTEKLLIFMLNLQILGFH